MKFSLRMLISLVAGVSAGLALLVNAMPAAAAVSDLALVVVLLVAMALLVGSVQPSRSFWLATVLVAITVKCVLLPNFPVFRELRTSLRSVVLLPSFHLLHPSGEAVENAPKYIEGDHVVVREKRPDGAWHRMGDYPIDGVAWDKLDIASLPAVADFADFYRIAVNLLAIGIGLLCGWVALAVRQRQTNAASGGS